MSDTPRTDEQINGKPCTRFAFLAGDSLRDALVPSEFARELERELHEQCLLNGKGSEREAALLGKVSRLERELAAAKHALELSNSAYAAIDAARAAIAAGEGKP